MEEGSFRLLYSDTDSLASGLSKPKEDLIRPELKEEFEQKKKKWYLLDDSPTELRTPGKLKPEFLSKNAVLYGVLPKCYLLHCFDDDETKKAHKGVNSSKLTQESYKSAVYDMKNDLFDTFTQFPYNKQTSKMQTIDIKKKSINSFYTKFELQPDFVTLKPLRKKTVV